MEVGTEVLEDTEKRHLIPTEGCSVLLSCPVTVCKDELGALATGFWILTVETDTSNPIEIQCYKWLVHARGKRESTEEADE